MSELKYKIGDKVRIKSLDWYNANKNQCDEIPLFKPRGLFVPDMSRYCNNIMTIKDICYGTCYRMKEDFWNFNWTDEMIEGLVEEETPKFKIGDKITNGKTQLTILNIIFDKYIAEDNFGESSTLYLNTQDDWKLVEEETSIDLTVKGEEVKERIEITIPEGYEYVIESGKIIFTKKKKEYPKTYEKCCEILNIIDNRPPWHGYRSVQLKIFQKLLICLDAYRKIAGEEMGLDKPWEPSDSDYITGRYCIFVHKGNIICDTPAQDCVLTFPTEEMRDAFYDNFKKEIEICKEIL